MANRREFLQNATGLIALLHPAWVTEAAPASPRVTGNAARPVHFQHVRLRTRRLEEMRTFYEEKLGLPRVALQKDSVTYRAGRSEIQFVQIPEGPDPVYHFAFNIPENKLDAGQRWLAPRCPIVTRPDGSTVYDFAHWNAHAFYFLDPSGNILEFIARHNLKNAASGAFSLRDILQVSEVGLVVPDVAHAIESLQSRLGLSVYVGSSDVFAPVGDEQGLFILVKTGRQWLGSDKYAAQFPAEVQMHGLENERNTLPDGPFQVDLKR